MRSVDGAPDGDDRSIAFVVAAAGLAVAATRALNFSLAIAGPYSLLSGPPGACPNPLPAGGSCSITLAFSPVTPGTQTGALTVTSNASGSPHTAPLSGIGTQPTVSLAPSPANFGSVVVNTISNLNVSLTNIGSAPLAISTLSVSGAFFTKTGATCAASLAAGSSCSISIAYSPTAAGTHSGQLSLSSDAPGSPHLVSLAGTGTAPGVSLTPTPVAFGNVPVGSSASASLTLSNTGTATLTISSIATTAVEFVQSNGCGASLAPGAFCSITVTYSPGAAGSHSGQLNVVTNAAALPTVAALSGTGTAPGVSLTPGPVNFGNLRSRRSAS